MIKRILAVGDSFTYGDELENKERAYPYLLASGFKAEVVNQAKPGSGNKKMIREICNAIAEGEDYDLYIIGWSSPGRMEFADADGIFDIWPGYSGNMFRRDGQNWRLDLLEYINQYHDPAWIYENYLRDIILLQNFLTMHDKKYIMLTTVANEYYHHTCFTKYKKLASMVNDRYFLGWPTEGMAEWTGGCKRGPNGHFLEDGHKKVTVKLYQYIRSLGWA